MDVTQEVLASLEKKLPDWEVNPNQGKLRGWLFRVARNLAVNKIIERARLPVALERTGGSAIIEVVDHRSDSSQEFTIQYRRRLLHWAADRVRQKVSESTWQAFWVTAMEGLSADVVSRQIEMSPGNVYAAKFRVMARIQKVVASVSGLGDEPSWLEEDENE